jgi:hypothetical protein
MSLCFSEWFVESEKAFLFFENEIADYLKSAADEIARIVGNKVVVILGRDAWPLVPLLRYRGVRTQYFLYSRLQIGDPSTKELWLKEVPRRSFVIDTGYAGSIIDDIKKFDPSVKGILLSSDGKYPELKVDGIKINRRDIVDDIEHSPKLINRSKGYKGPYALISSDPASDVGVRDAARNVMKSNQDLLQSAGLPDEVAKKYRNFSGISPKDRIGKDDYLSHWLKVEKGRKGKEKNRLEWHDRWDLVVKAIKEGKKVENWVWRDIPSEIRDELGKKAIIFYYKLKQSLIDAEEEIEKIPSWDVDYLKELQEKIKRRRIRFNKMEDFISGLRYFRYF